MKRIIIVVDLGHFKAYRVSKELLESTKITLIASYDSVEGHGKLGDKLSDKAGRFRRAEGKKKAATGYGEPHNLKTENEKRLVKLIAKDIGSLIAREHCEKWDLAATSRINRLIIDNLKPAIKAKLHKSITVDLTKIDKSEILSYFD
jgi:hypothetical protein